MSNLSDLILRIESVEREVQKLFKEKTALEIEVFELKKIIREMYEHNAKLFKEINNRKYTN